MIIQSFINSAFQKGAAAFTKKNPYTQAEQHQVEGADLMQAVQSIQGAQKAFAEWKTSSLEDRITLLTKIKDNLVQEKSQFAKLEAQDQALPVQFVEQHGVEAAIDSFESAITQLKNHKPSETQFFSPNGLVVIVASWNLSLRVISERLAPALAAGNSVIIKVSSSSPVTAMILGQILQQAQAPSGLVQVLVSNQQDVKDILISHPGVKAVSFVGNLKNSAEVLKKVTAQSFNQFKKIQIASGSKNSAVALSAPTDQQFNEIIRSFMIGQGQLSWNSNRLFILEKYEQEWVDRITKYLADLRPATSIEDDSMWTPCLKTESFEQFTEIENLAIQDKAHLLQVSRPLSDQQKKSYLKPTFTKDMSNCSTLQQDQVTAPLFILSVVKYPFDVAKYSNVSYYGQSAHIWAEESKVAKIAEQLDIAQIFVNKWSAERHGPNKGVKQSGFGLQDYQVFGDFFSNVKNLT
ncbi:MAG: aldehyde dehydrogenase family protein [Bdellovibrio sp.]|nr:aldehyde dehydrogenase family protein [Bdellovibrio sp.]